MRKFKIIKELIMSHELKGSDLTRAMLARGDKKNMVRSV